MLAASMEAASWASLVNGVPCRKSEIARMNGMGWERGIGKTNLARVRNVHELKRENCSHEIAQKKHEQSVIPEHV